MATDNPYLSAGALGHGYEGALSLGPTRPQPLGLLGLAQTEDENAILERERASRLPLLFEHFGIEPSGPSAWEHLARALAAKHVPGFSWNYQSSPLDLSSFLLAAQRLSKRGRGRPRKAPRYDGRYGLLGTVIEKPKRPAYRPARFTVEQKRQFVERVDERMAQLKAEVTGAANQRELIAQILSGDPDVNLRLYHRLKREIKDFDKSHENIDVNQILGSLGRTK